MGWTEREMVLTSSVGKSQMRLLLILTQVSSA